MGFSKGFTRNVPGVMQQPGMGIYKGGETDGLSFETMAQGGEQAKPVHLICNNEQVIAEIQERWGTEIGARDWTDNEGFHIHVAFYWPVVEGALSPTREGAVRSWRRRFGCPACAHRGSNYKCPDCKLYFRFHWIGSREYFDNTRRYIERKIEADPLVDIAVPYAEDNGAYEEPEAIIAANEGN